MSIASTKERHHAHHFKDAEHEFETSKMGVWVFLCTEIVMFGGLFVAYAIFSNTYPQAWAEGATHLNWKLGAINTVVLLLSSFTMAVGIYYAARGENKKCANYLWFTFFCGIIFMAIKAFEYTHKFELGLYPGKFFNYADATSQNLPIYFSVYYCMTGLHAIHVFVGMGLIAWVALRAGRKKEFSAKYYTPVECVGLFWHLVDLVWIYLFPLLYLVD